MHIVTLSTALDRADGTKLEAGSYLVDDLNAAEIMVEADRGTAVVRYFADINRRQLQDPAANAILVIHPGGLGDQMMLGPALRAHKRYYPGITIHVCCRRRHRIVYEHLDYPDAFVDYPLNMDGLFGRYSRIILTENMNEGERGRTAHGIYLRAEILGVDLKGDTKVEYKVTDQERADAAARYPRQSYEGRIETVPRKRIGIQLAASAFNRTMSAQKMSSLIHSLYMEDWEIMIFGSEGSTGALFKGVPEPVMVKVRERLHDCAQAELTFRQSAAVAETCDVIVAPDSSMMHIAGALNVPCVALFGPIDYKIRTAYYLSVFALHGNSGSLEAGGCPIAPCGFHPRGGIHFPKNGPCALTGHCHAIDSIKLEAIGRKIQQLILP